MLGVLSDAHGNLYAFKRALKILTCLGAEEFVYLGDAVGYIPSVKVVQHLMEMNNLLACVRGNHETMLLGQDVESEREDIYQLKKTKSLINEEQIRFISSQHISFGITLSATRLFFVHGSPHKPTTGYVYPDSDLSEYKINADFVFMGHSHHPFIRKFNDTTYVNVGSCGLPRDDGRFGAASLFNPETGEVKIIRFDIEGLARRTLSEAVDIHPSVRELFDRRKEDLYGDYYEI